MPNFMKIRPVGAELFHANGRRDSTTKKNVAFRNFAKTSKNFCFRYKHSQKLQKWKLSDNLVNTRIHAR